MGRNWISVIGCVLGCGDQAPVIPPPDAGATFDGSPAACLTPAPGPDPTFDSRPISPTGEMVNTWALSSDSKGRWLLAGATDPGTHSYVLRLTPNGELDPTFGKEGLVVLSIADTDVASAAREDALGRVLVGGSTSNANYVARLTELGNLDVTFAATGPQPGVALLDSSLQGAPLGLAADASGIYVAGGNTPSYVAAGGFLLRLTPDGVVDSAFAVMKSPRSVHNPLPVGDGVLYDDGDLWRLDAKGHIDPTFGGGCVGGGCAPVGAAPLPPGLGEHGVVTTWQGFVAVSDQIPSIGWRFDIEGQFDSTFGTAGTSTVAGVAARVVAAACDRIIVAGEDGRGGVAAAALGLDGNPVPGDPPPSDWAWAPQDAVGLLVAVDPLTGRIVFAEDTQPAGTVFIAGFHL